MATALGTVPLTLGSEYKWQATLTKDGATWDLSAQTVKLWWKRPNGTKFSQPADSATSGGVVTYSDVASQLDTIGDWTFSVQVAGYGWTVPVTFRVVNSP